MMVCCLKWVGFIMDMNMYIDKHLIRLAIISKYANFTRDPFTVAKNEVDMAPKDMFIRVRRLFEEEYAPVYSATPIDDGEVVKRYSESFSKISNNIEKGDEIAVLLMLDENTFIYRIRVLTQFLNDNDKIKEDEFVELVNALYKHDQKEQFYE